MRLRIELDRVVGEVVIPERARATGVKEPADVTTAMQAAWANVKQTWK
jgi:hypothetical protein